MTDYYGELCTKMYELDKSIAKGNELDFYLSFVLEGMTVLEPMCGNGRMLIPFMERGIHIEGFDISEPMLKLCKEKGESLGLTPNVFNQRIEDFKEFNKYDLIVIPFGSFSLLPTELVNKSLQNMKAALKDNGRFLLTVMLKHDVMKINDWVETRKHPFDNGLIVEYKMVDYEEEQSLLTTKLKYQLMVSEEIIKTEFMDMPVRLYDLDEFTNTLMSNQFYDIKVHKVKDGYGEGIDFHVFVCSQSPS